MKKILLAVNCFLLIGGIAFAQENAQFYNFKNQANVVPPAPNAAALAKYAEIPVTLNTGIPQVSVSIYEWKSNRGNTVVRVGLSYHAGGIKVEDIASNVGLGWSLQAGGVITRSVRGRPDEDGAFGYLGNAAIPNYNTSINTGGYYLNPSVLATEYSTMDTSRLNILAHFNDPGGDIARTYDFYQGTFDTEQDVFYYNAAGLSGSFVLDKDGAVKKLDENDVEITIQYSSYPAIAGFVLQNDDGIKYIFEAGELTSYMNHVTQRSYNYSGTGASEVSSSPTPAVENYFSSFYLTKMVDLNSQDTVRFEYVDRTINTAGSFSESIEYHDNDDPKVYYSHGSQTDQKISSRSSSILVSEIETKHLRRILLPDSGSITFFYDNRRNDLPGDTVLNRIEVLDRFGNAQRYVLHQTYFNSASVSNPTFLWPRPLGFAADHFEKRLRLDSIRRVTAFSGGSHLLVNSFVYNDTLLPPRNSYELDHWGYYYGPDRYAYTTIPQIHAAIEEVPPTEGVVPFNNTANLLNMFTSGANRIPDESYGRAAILKRINHPTGGHTAFTYETNRVDGELFHNSYHNYTATSTQYTSLTQKKLISFIDRSSTEVMFFVNIKRVNNLGEPFVPPPPPEGPQSCLSDVVELSKISFYVESSDGLVTKLCTLNAIPVGEANVKVYFSLPLNKNYRLYYDYNEENDPCLDTVYFNINTSIRYISDRNGSLVGGQRIARVSYIDPLAEKSVNTQYSYVTETNTSSGVLPVIPNYSENVRADGKWTCCDDECGLFAVPVFLGYAKFKSRTSTTRQTLSYTGGSNIGYSRVVHGKEDGAGVKLGVTVSQYIQPSVMNQWTVYPYKPVQTLDWAGGQLGRESVYDRDENLLKRTDYNYSFSTAAYTDEKNRSVKIACIRTDECMGFFPYNNVRLVAFAYYPYHGKSRLIGKREVDFSGTDSLVKIFEYGYYGTSENLAYTALNNTSTGEILVSRSRFPGQYTHAGMLKLVANKVWGIPVSTYEYIDRSLSLLPDKELTASAVDFAVHGNYARPATYSRLNTADPNTQTTFNPAAALQSTYVISDQVLQYDTYGNVCEVKGEDGIVKAIIWAYGYTKPVAEITGATYAQAIAKFTTTSVAGIQAITDDAVMRSKLNEIRSGFSSDPTVQVKSFTFRPLIGMTSITDERGRSSYLEYDGFGRLVIKRDHDGNVLERICYKYFNEAEVCDAACTNTSADWQNSSIVRCVVDGNNDPTGYVEQEEVDVNPCSATYNQKRWATPVYNPGECAPVETCNISNCSGNDKKCIGGVCETGTWIAVSAVREGGLWKCTFRYCFSDGSLSAYSQTTTSPLECVVFTCP